MRVFLYEKGYLHAKTLSIDAEVCSIGSANLDIRSFSINYELNAVLYSAAARAGAGGGVRRDLADCTEFDAVEYSRKNPAVRFRTGGAPVLSVALAGPTSAGTFSTTYHSPTGS